jgi:hypothetical protein
MYHFHFACIVCGTDFSQQCGDVNASGDIDILDALIVAHAYVELNPANYNSSLADVNANGSIVIVETLILRWSYFFTQRDCRIYHCEETIFPMYFGCSIKISTDYL